MLMMIFKVGTLEGTLVIITFHKSGNLVEDLLIITRDSTNWETIN